MQDALVVMTKKKMCFCDNNHKILEEVTVNNETIKNKSTYPSNNLKKNQKILNKNINIKIKNSRFQFEESKRVTVNEKYVPCLVILFVKFLSKIDL